jgi:hypothetical protein
MTIVAAVVKKTIATAINAEHAEIAECFVLSD